MVFQRESVTGCRDEIVPLLKAHYAEIARYQDIPLDPDWDAYVAVEATGALRVFTVRDADRRLVGYAVFFVRANAHYRTSLQAVQDILFLDPPLRGRFIGFKFIKWCDEQLRAEGVQAVYHHVKAAHNFGPMLERLGYEQVDLIYGRRLDKE